jgi:hypothetical protein
MKFCQMTRLVRDMTNLVKPVFLVVVAAAEIRLVALGVSAASSTHSLVVIHRLVEALDNNLVHSEAQISKHKLKSTLLTQFLVVKLRCRSDRP